MNRRALSGLAGLGVGMCVVLLLVMLQQQVALLGQVKQEQEGGRSVLNTIRSCTTPTGRCYRAGEVAQRASVDSINEVTVYAATCAKRWQTVAGIERCVLAYLHDLPQPHIDRGLPKTPRSAIGGSSPKVHRGHRRRTSHRHTTPARVWPPGRAVGHHKHPHHGRH